jgi:hypothetical protein
MKTDIIYIVYKVTGECDDYEIINLIAFMSKVEAEKYLDELRENHKAYVDEYTDLRKKHKRLNLNFPSFFIEEAEYYADIRKYQQELDILKAKYLNIEYETIYDIMELALVVG